MKTFKPILFSTGMVQAIFEGRKTHTRRVVKGEGTIEKVKDNLCVNRTGKGNSKFVKMPKYQTGDILWVRETWKESPKQATWQKYSYKANYHPALAELGKWKPSIFMPKEACRLFLEVTNVRCEKLNDISEEDAGKEGIYVLDIDPMNPLAFNYTYNGSKKAFFSTKDGFEHLWKSINGENSWTANPFVWVYEFKVIEKPLNFNQ